MSAYVICTPSWSMCTVLEDPEPEKLGKTLVNLIRDHGEEEVSDVLSDGYCWEYLDEDIADDDEVVVGYGKLIKDIFFDVGEYDYIYGIMSDGALLITHCGEDDRAFVDPKSEGALERMDQIFK